MATIAAHDDEGISVRVATRRWIAAAGLATTASIGVVAPASASTPGPHYDVGPTFNAYTDSATPNETTYYPSGGETPVGTSVDENGVTHTTRAYAAFDIGGMNDVRLQHAVVLLPDYNGDCDADRDLTVRETRPFDDNTWANPPATRGAAVPVTAEVCGPISPQADVTTMLDRALTRGDSRLWLEIRVPARHETNPAFFRTILFNDVRLQVTLTNRAPDKPTDLTVYNDDTPCSGDFVSGTDFGVSAKMTDADRNPGDVLTSEFEWWPAGDPAELHAMPAGISSGADGLRGVATVPASTMADGRYAWHARTFDERAYSPWSDACSFTVDRTPPATAPTVASPEYPENSATPVGGAYREGTFLFTANGDPDVVRFAYGQDGYAQNWVEADQQGGAAVVSWYPNSSGRHTLTVWSLDSAGNRSAPRNYAINVA